jgi:hypothetical protein
MALANLKISLFHTRPLFIISCRDVYGFFVVVVVVVVVGAQVSLNQRRIVIQQVRNNPINKLSERDGERVRPSQKEKER